MSRRAPCAVAVATLALVACAADKPPPASPTSTPEAQAPGYAQPQQQYAPQPGNPPPAAPPAPTTPSRAYAADFDKAQRELEVAAGDCTNACRALTSMDRAAGRICTLASASEDEAQRCSDAKNRVYSARDKVKSTCGTCPDTSVERRDPVPSSK